MHDNPAAMSNVVGQGMMDVDDEARGRIDPAPEAERLGGGKDFARRLARKNEARRQGHLTTNPWAKGSRSSMKMVL